jgi:uncharacterized lipoprotein YbaY
MFARIALSFAMVAILAGGTAQAQTSRLMGQVSYPDRVQLGKTAVLEVTLVDVSDATGAGVVIATTRIPRPGQTPVIFSMESMPPASSPRGATPCVCASWTPVRRCSNRRRPCVLTQG